MWEAQNGQAEAAARREARTRRRSECDLEFDEDEDPTGGAASVGLSSTDMWAATTLEGRTGVGLGLGGTGGDISNIGGGSASPSSGGSSGSGSGGTFTTLFSTTSSITAAVASVRRRRNEVERGAAASAEDLADRVIGRYDLRWPGPVTPTQGQAGVGYLENIGVKAGQAVGVGTVEGDRDGRSG